VSGLTDIDDQPVVDGADVAINLYDQNNVLVETGMVVQADSPDNDTYYADITLPDVTRPTKFVAKASGSQSTSEYRDIGTVWVVSE
jgi:2-keto-4-pentenoate hydratase